MERSFGKKLTHIPSSEQESQRRMAQALMASFLKQVFEDDFFHGDPHLSNTFLLEDGRLCFRDFGTMGRLSTYNQEALTQLILAVSSDEMSQMVDAYFEMEVVTEGMDRKVFTRDASQVPNAYYEAAGKGYSFGEAVCQFALLSRRHQTKLPHRFLLVSRAFMLVKSQALALTPDFDALVSLREYAPRLLGHKLLQGASVQTEFSRGFHTLRASHHAAALLPDILNCTVETFSSGKATLHIRHDQL